MDEILNEWLQEKPKDKFDKELHKYTYYDLMEFAEHYYALQLQQTGVKSSVLIEFKEWDYTCGDGCCTSFGTKLLLNGKELEHPNEEIKDNSYVGDDTQTAINAILKELGYEVKFG